ncbi:L,D-transpeptidase family protein [Stagnihabitans tardus]|uniref:L,D-transpeptidase family protein n=1 Tax=Stagnihabitans tardus TaxID=2699202 RepID=A0AAE5BUA0_9RHOB|nr:L,D-transpeptidase family protein [Stagnihabitans tardus]NBZ87636.1 L,D-transpeptidase family protein [Stagnihabitans tardus]
MRRAVPIAAATGLCLAAATLAYTKVAARLWHGTPPPMAPTEAQADRVLVEKSSRLLTLMRGDQVLAQYEVSLGARGDAGPKTTRGDERTPEGHYVIDWRNPESIAHLSLHISYPRPEDLAQAKVEGRDPGGDIMIHGLPNGWGALSALHLIWDWTDGCIAVTNAQMQDIWSRVPDGTPIEIRS